MKRFPLGLCLGTACDDHSISTKYINNSQGIYPNHVIVTNCKISRGLLNLIEYSWRNRLSVWLSKVIILTRHRRNKAFLSLWNTSSVRQCIIAFAVGILFFNLLSNSCFGLAVRISKSNRTSNFKDLSARKDRHETNISHIYMHKYTYMEWVFGVVRGHSHRFKVGPVPCYSIKVIESYLWGKQ